MPKHNLCCRHDRGLARSWIRQPVHFWFLDLHVGPFWALYPTLQYGKLQSRLVVRVMSLIFSIQSFTCELGLKPWAAILATGFPSFSDPCSWCGYTMTIQIAGCVLEMGRLDELQLIVQSDFHFVVSCLRGSRARWSLAWKGKEICNHFGGRPPLLIEPDFIASVGS